MMRPPARNGKTKAIVVFALLAMRLGMAQALHAQCPSYAPIAAQRDVATRLSPAVLHIQCGNEKGTAYVIDAEGGYLLTAAHVVSDCKRSGKAVESSGKYAPRGSVTLLVVDALGDRDKLPDLALLQARGRQPASAAVLN